MGHDKPPRAETAFTLPELLRLGSRGLAMLADDLEARGTHSVGGSPAGSAATAPSAAHDTCTCSPRTTSSDTEALIDSQETCDDRIAPSPSETTGLQRKASDAVSPQRTVLGKRNRAVDDACVPAHGDTQADNSANTSFITEDFTEDFQSSQEQGWAPLPTFCLRRARTDP